MKRTRWIVASLGVAVCGLLSAAPARAQQDPGTPGPHAVTKTSYGSFTTGSVSLGQISTIEVLAEVQYPTDLANGPYPLVVLLHGRHVTCYNPSTNAALLVWPCSSPMIPIPSYQGYDYLASLLASQGMIVVSISANGINAADNGTSSLGADERARLIQLHLDKWNTFNVSGGTPFGTTFVGHVDMSRVGTMGHSRGGEGVVWSYERNASLGFPYGIRAVLPLAPLDAFGHVINNVPVGVVVGYCDGDLYTLPGVAYVDEARYNVAGDTAPKYTTLVLGANHNYFNRIWTPDQFAGGSSDDWGAHDPGQTDSWCGTSAGGNGRLTSAQERGAGAAYMAAFFRRHLFGDTQFDAFLTGDAAPPPSAQTTKVYSGFVPAAPDRKDLNRLLGSSALTANDFGGTVTTSGFAVSSLCGGPSEPLCENNAAREPHAPNLSSLDLAWSTFGAVYSNQLPTFTQDVSNFSTIEFREAMVYNDTRNLSGQPQDFSVRITSGAGTATVKASTFARGLFFPPADASRKAAVFNSVRIPMSAFSPIDRTSVMSVDVVFDQKQSGGVTVTDLGFAGEGITVAEEWHVSRMF